MPIDFPNNPSTNQYYTVGDTTWRYTGTRWELSRSTAMSVSDTAPTSPTVGNVWYNSTNGKAYIYYDSYWVEFGESSSLVIPAHASNHIRSGSDIIDGDRLQVDYSPTAYTSYSSATGAGATTDLTAHLGGIDQYLMSATGRNRIINGAMMVDQRYAGVAQSGVANFTRAADMFMVYKSAATLSTQRVSNDGPAGVGPYSIKITNGTALSLPVANTAYHEIQHKIEGYNVADLGFGTASPQPLVLSFYVKSSIAGVYPVVFKNSAENRSYVSTYTISAANTWERKSVALTADASGTWLTDNGMGLLVSWTLGGGSNFSTSSVNTWLAGSYTTTSSATAWVGTTGATWQLSGVQLEYGIAPTRFEVRSYDDELRRCQRYYNLLASGSGLALFFAHSYTVGNVYGPITLPVNMRVAPNMDATTGTNYYIFLTSGTNATASSINLQDAGTQIITLTIPASATVNNNGWVRTNNAAARVAVTSEL